MNGTPESSFLPSFLFITMVLAVVNATFVCPQDDRKMLDLCNSTVECPVYQQDSIVSVRSWVSSVSASCRVVLKSQTAVSLLSVVVANLTPSAACSPWFAAGQPTSSSAAALRSTCSSARYRALRFFFPGDVVMTFVRNPPSDKQLPLLAFQEVELRWLCTAVISLNSSSYVVPPLDFADGGNCTSRLESPPGTVMRLALSDSHPRASDGGGLSSDCVCYRAEGIAATASGCLTPDLEDDEGIEWPAFDGTATLNPELKDAGDIRSPTVGDNVTLTVKGDSAGLLCSAVIYITVSPRPEQSTSVGKGSRLCSCPQLLLLLLLCEAARLRLVPT